MSTHTDSPTDVSTILRALNDSRLANRELTAGSHAATMNFIVFVDDAAHRPWVLERAQVIVEKHPARLIVFDSTGATTGVDISTIVRQVGESPVVSERADIGVGSLDNRTIGNIAQELAVPDIPTILWWSGARLLKSRTFAWLTQLASTVVVDSSGKARDEETIRELGAFSSRFPAVTLHDLAFMRLAPWRDIIAQFFDDPSLRQDLFSIERVTIASGSEAEALYLAGWLGSRLSWTPVGRDRLLDRRGSSVHLVLKEEGEQRRVGSVTLEAGGSHYRAALSPDDTNVVRLCVEGARRKDDWYVPLSNIENTTLIERAFLTASSDDIFETSLETVRALLA